MEKYSSWHKNNQIILCICPKCKRISRFGELRIILTEKFPNTWRDDYDKKLTSFQAKEDEFSSKESAIRKEAIEKARKQLPKLIKKSLSDQITSLKFNPYDIKPILYPIDYVIYDGMEKGSIDNVIFLQIYLQIVVPTMIFQQRPHDCVSINQVHMKTLPNLSVYDKALQSRTGPARVRFEVQLDRTYLRANFPRLGDLNEAALRQSFQAHFSKVIEFLQADDKALYDLQLSEADKKTMREIVGYETLCEKGYTETLTRSVRRRFEDFHKRHSIRQVSDLL